MKKLFTILCATVLTCSLYAQKDAGTKLVGVNSNFQFTSFSPEGGGDSQSSMALGLHGGYFVIENMAITVGLGYAQVGDADANTSFGIGARYYIGDIFPFVGYGSPAEDMSDLALGCGYSWMLNDNIALEPTLSYIMHSYDGDSMGSTFGLKVGFSLYF